MNHLLLPNLSLIVSRQAAMDGDWNHVLVATQVGDARALYSARGIQSQVPLWLYERNGGGGLLATSAHKHSNFSPDFLAELKSKIGPLPIAPEDVFAYIYALLYAPGYRRRYGAFLKRDFPRVPLTGDPALFRKLAKLGRRLIDLHLLRATGRREPGYPVAGNNRVERAEYKDGRVYLNAEQYFDGVPAAVWDFHVGGYRVTHKWLKDRKGRLLTFDELQHYRRVVAAIDETLAVQAQIDAAIPGWPLA